MLSLTCTKNRGIIMRTIDRQKMTIEISRAMGKKKPTDKSLAELARVLFKLIEYNSRQSSERLIISLEKMLKRVTCYGKPLSTIL